MDTRLLNLANDVQAIGLVGGNIQYLKKKKKKSSDLIGLGATNLIGTSLIRSNAQLIGSL